MEAGEKRYSIPGKYVVIPRDDWFIFFDPVQFSYARVNDHGRAILESLGGESSANEIAESVAAKFGLNPGDIETQISGFLENMVYTGFVHEGPYAPELTEPYDMDKSRPKSMYVSPTFACNLKCIYCYNKKQRKEAEGSELTTEEWFKVFKQAKELGVKVVAFTGGEPLLRRDVFELAGYVRSIGMTATILTNGMLVTDDNIDKLVESFGSFALSLDSHIEATNDFLRGKGAFRTTVNAIRLLQERGRLFTVMAVITRHNVFDIPGLHRYCLEELDCSDVFTSPYIPNSIDEVGLLPELSDYMKAMADVVDVVEDFYGEDRLSILKFRGKPVRHCHCGAAALEISVDADGSVYPCQAFHVEEFCGGNVKDRSLSEIFFESPIMQEVRHCTVNKIETCRDCDIREACGGGCRSLAYNLHGKLDSCNSYNCDYLKSIVYNSLWNATCIPIDQLRDLQVEHASE